MVVQATLRENACDSSRSRCGASSKCVTITVCSRVVVAQGVEREIESSTTRKTVQCQLTLRSDPTAMEDRAGQGVLDRPLHAPQVLAPCEEVNVA